MWSAIEVSSWIFKVSSLSLHVIAMFIIHIWNQESCVPVWRFESYISAQSMEEQDKVHGKWARLASNDRRSSFFHSTMPFNLDSNATAQLPPPAYALFDILSGCKCYTKWVRWKCRLQWKQQEVALEGPPWDEKVQKLLCPKWLRNQQLADSQNWLKLLYHLQHARC